MQKVHKYYCVITFAYGAVHAIRELWSFKTYYKNKKQEMALVDKLSMGVGMTGSAYFLWPVLLRQDLIRLECLLRGKSVTDYLPYIENE
jgi:hypothetical protein